MNKVDPEVAERAKRAKLLVDINAIIPIYRWPYLGYNAVALFFFVFFFGGGGGFKCKEMHMESLIAQYG